MPHSLQQRLLQRYITVMDVDATLGAHVLRGSFDAVLYIPFG